MARRVVNRPIRRRFLRRPTRPDLDRRASEQSWRVVRLLPAPPPLRRLSGATVGPRSDDSRGRFGGNAEVGGDAQRAPVIGDHRETPVMTHGECRRFAVVYEPGDTHKTADFVWRERYHSDLAAFDEVGDVDRFTFPSWWRRHEKKRLVNGDFSDREFAPLASAKALRSTAAATKLISAHASSMTIAMLVYPLTALTNAVSSNSTSAMTPSSSRLMRCDNCIARPRAVVRSLRRNRANWPSEISPRRKASTAR